MQQGLLNYKVEMIKHRAFPYFVRFYFKTKWDSPQHLVFPAWHTALCSFGRLEKRKKDKLCHEEKHTTNINVNLCVMISAQFYDASCYSASWLICVNVSRGSNLIDADIT